MKNLPYPKTEDEWWSNVDEAWDSLLNILNTYLDLWSKKDGWDDDGNPIEVHCPTDPPITLGRHIKKLRENRDPELVRWFNRAWLNAPDNPEIHSIPHWGTLCDLCSEEWVLHPEEVNNE